MKNYLSILKKTNLFLGIDDADIISILTCCKAEIKNYAKGEYIFRQGQYVSNLTLLLEGKVHIQKEDYWGNLSILNEIPPGEIFAKSYATPDSGVLLNDVLATEDSTVLSFNIDKIFSVCPANCHFHTKIIKNLFYIISYKNRNLVQKLGYMSQRTTKEKLLSYLSDEANKQHSNSIVIPFNRQQLADFLSVDRSAMSNELCKMRNEGIIDFCKNKFTLHKKF